MKTLQYQPGDLNYRVPNPFSNPFDKRRLAPQATLNHGSPQCREAGGLGYNLRYYNHSSIFEDRKMRTRIEINPKAKRIISWVEEAQGNDLRAVFLLRRLLRRVIDDCRDKPILFQGHAENLLRMTQLEGIDIPFIQAFEQIESFEELLNLLETISDRPGAFQFELAGAAILQFYRKHFSADQSA